MSTKAKQKNAEKRRKLEEQEDDRKENTEKNWLGRGGKKEEVKGEPIFSRILLRSFTTHVIL